MADDDKKPEQIPPWFADAEDAQYSVVPVPKKPGVKTKLTPQLRGRVCRLIEMGTPMETAAKACGIGRSTLYEWCLKGNQSRAGIYHEFVEAMHRAVAIGHVRMGLAISRAANAGDWRAAAFFLERRVSREWSRKETMALEHSGPDGGPVEVKAHREKLVKMVETPELRDALSVIAAAMMPVRDRTKKDVYIEAEIGNVDPK